MNKRNFTRSTETIELGTFLHLADNHPVLKLVCPNIPYPNSPVLHKDRIIGKIDEVLGSFDEVYVSFILDGPTKLKNNEMLFAYKDKFMMKHKFLPRSEVEKKKEENDKKRKGSERGKSEGRSDMKKDFKRDLSKRRDYKTSYGDNKENKRGGDRGREYKGGDSRKIRDDRNDRGGYKTRDTKRDDVNRDDRSKSSEGRGRFNRSDDDNKNKRDFTKQSGYSSNRDEGRNKREDGDRKKHKRFDD